MSEDEYQRLCLTIAAKQAELDRLRAVLAREDRRRDGKQLSAASRLEELTDRLKGTYQ